MTLAKNLSILELYKTLMAQLSSRGRVFAPEIFTFLEFNNEPYVLNGILIIRTICGNDILIWFACSRFAAPFLFLPF